MHPLTIYRFSNFLYRHKVPLIPNILDYLNRLIFSCWIPHTCTIGENSILGYQGLGIVIHNQAIIGKNVHIDQLVTIGGNATGFGVPILASNIYIGAGAKILGPIRIGNNCIIGANAVVVKDIPDGSIVVGVPARVIKSGITLENYLHHKKSEH